MVKKGQTGDLPEFKVIPKEEVEQRANEVYEVIPVHFIGLRYYTVQSFIREAKEIGVNRALPPNVAKRFNWGDKIFLAIKSDKVTEDGKKKPGAVVFGFFTIDWVAVKAPPRVHEAIIKDDKINVIRYHDHSDKPIPEKRGCGEYNITGEAELNMNLPEFISRALVIARRYGAKIKILLGGRFTEVPAFRLDGLKFSQNIVYAYLPEETAEFIFDILFGQEKDDTQSKARFIRNYKLRKEYLKPERGGNI